MTLLVSFIVGLITLHFLTLNGKFGRLSKANRKRPEYLEMPYPAQWTQLNESTWSCTDMAEERDVDLSLSSTYANGTLQAAEGSEDRRVLEAQKRSIKRRRQCVVKTMCVDAKGAFILSNGDHTRNMPEINMISADKTADTYWQPRVKSVGRGTKAHFVDEVLFIRGLYEPYHLSHYLYNSVFPLMSTMKRFNGTARSWILREGNAKGFYNPKHLGNWEIQEIFQQDELVQSATGKTIRKIYSRELVLDQDELSSEYQTLPPRDVPICFREAVVGTGSQCGQAYCERNVPTSIYTEFYEKMATAFWSTKLAWTNHVNIIHQEFLRQHVKGQVQDAGLQPIYIQQQGQTAQTTAAQEFLLASDGSPMTCLLNTKYSNFGGNARSVSVEPSERIGRGDLDGQTDLNSTKRIVVALIQRESSRKVVNMDVLHIALVAKGFRVKYITFDHGCGLGATAYLLRDVDFMVTPHGNAIGTSVFMPRRSHATVLSIDNSLHDEPWFMWTTSAVGTRFLQHQNGPHNIKLDPLIYPTVRNMETALYVMNYCGLKLNRGRNAQGMIDFNDTNDELLILTGGDMEAIQALRAKYKNEGDKIGTFLGDYWKEAPRYLDVSKVVKMAEQIEQDSVNDANKTFTQICLENRCCGNYCERISATENVFLRNVVGNTASHGMLATPSEWGMYLGSDGIARKEKTPDDLAKEFIPGEQLKSWHMDF
ncbi:hypothetical protein BG004_000456 [Podila humilis]|nr:hypothetical protein BG004_000456 [Podila humilis]